MRIWWCPSEWWLLTWLDLRGLCLVILLMRAKRGVGWRQIAGGPWLMTGIIMDRILSRWVKGLMLDWQTVRGGLVSVQSQIMSC